MPGVSSYGVGSAASGDFLLGTDPSGVVERYNMQAIKPTPRILTAAHSSTTPATSTTITDGTTPWTFSCVAGKTYRVSVIATYQSNTQTVGVRMSLLGSGGVAGQLNGYATGAVTVGSVATDVSTTLNTLGTSSTAWPTGSNLLTPSVSPVNAPHHIDAEFIFRCTTAGSISIQHAPEVAGTTQFNIGSTLIVEELN